MPKITIQGALAGGIAVLFALAMIAAFVTGDHELAHQLAEGLLNILIAIASYYFGSSQGSSKKDDTIAAALNQTPTIPPAQLSPEHLPRGDSQSSASS